MMAQVLKDYYQEHAQYVISSERAEYCEARLMPFYGNRFVAHVTPSLVKDYVRQCQARGESNGTIRRDLEHLRAALNHEVSEQRLLYAPKIKLPSAPEPRSRYLTKDEVDSLLSKCTTPHIKSFIEIMLATGQRPGAVENLTWFQVDFDNRIIHFERDGKQKTNKRVRPVPMSDELFDILARLHKTKGTEYVLEFVQENKKKGTRKVRWAGCVKKAFKKACKDAGLTDVSRYTLRHTFGTQKYMDGHHEKDIGDIMGHTSAATTSKHYIKIDMERLRKVVGTTQIVRKRGKKKK